jgi:hypothetical protein
MRPITPLQPLLLPRPREPQLASRIEPLLHELARGSELGLQGSWDYIASFMRDGLGIPEYLINTTLQSIGAPALSAHEAQAFNELVGDLSPQHRAALSASERSQARAEADRFERMMREVPAEYWKPQNQEAYRQALERSLVEPPATPADGGPADLEMAPAPAAAPATPAPAPTAAAAP